MIKYNKHSTALAYLFSWVVLLCIACIDGNKSDAPGSDPDAETDENPGDDTEDVTDGTDQDTTPQDTDDDTGTTEQDTEPPDTDTDWKDEYASNPIAVQEDLIGMAKSSGDLRCDEIDLSSIKPLSNPGFRDETLNSTHNSGDELWQVCFYTMVYANCERQARGLKPFGMYSAEKQVAMQETVRGILESHENFGERCDITESGCAEGHGGTFAVGAEMWGDDLDKDDDNNKLWSPHECGREATAGLVHHGDAMINDDYSCIFAGATVSDEDWLDVVILYAGNCGESE